MKLLLHILVFMPLISACGAGLCIVNGQCSLSLNGTASLSFSVTSLNFGVKSFNQKNTASLLISNSGTVVASELSSSSIAAPFAYLDGTFPGTGGTCSDSIGPGASCILVLEYVPPVPKQTSASTLVLSFFDGQKQQTLELPVEGESDNGSFNNSLGFNNMADILPTADGYYAAGSFIAYNRTAAGRVMRFSSLDPVTIDGNFNPGGSGFNNRVTVILEVTGGGIYAFGDFTSYNGTARNRAIRLNANGSVNGTFNVSTGFNSTVTHAVMATDGSGDIYVGGQFTSYRGTAVGGIVRVNSNGTIDTGFNTGTGLASGFFVYFAAVPDGSNDVYVGGAFASYNGTTSTNIMRLNSDGTVDTAFVVGTGFNDWVNDLKVSTDGSYNLYVVGKFSSYKGTSRRKIVRLTPAGSLDAGFNVSTGFSSSLGADPSAVAISDDGSGDVYASGSFTSYRGTTRNGIVRINADGTVDSGFSVGTGLRLGAVSSAHTYLRPVGDGSGDIFVSHYFYGYNGNANTYAARIKADGTADSRFESYQQVQTQPTVGVAPDNSASLDIAAQYLVTHGTSHSGIVRVKSDGSLDSSFYSGLSFDTAPTAIQGYDAAGNLYVSGAFSFLNGNSVGSLVRITPGGSWDSSFAADTAGSVLDLEDSSGDLLVTGIFTTFNGTAANRVVRINSDGTNDASWNAGAGFSANAYPALALDGSGDIYFTGSFTTYDGSARNRIVRLNNSGSIDTGFNVGSGLNNFGNTIAPAKDGSGDVYVIGAFTSYSGTARNYIVRLNADGSVDNGFAVGTGFNNVTDEILVNADGTIYVAGQFTSYKGTTVPNLVRLLADGSLDTTFNAGSGFDTTPLSIQAARDGTDDIYVSGSFSAYNGVVTGTVVRITPDGSAE